MRPPLLLCVLAAAAGFSAAAHAGVGDYNNAALYPARVSAMQFANLMDANNQVIWGHWIVGFGKDLPTANWGTGNGYTTVTIGQILCVNKDGDDTHPCEFQMQFFDNGSEPICSVSDADETYVVDLTSVSCPSSISFAQ